MISALRRLLFLLCSMSHSIFWASDLRWSLKILNRASSFALVSSSTKWHPLTTSLERSDFPIFFAACCLPSYSLPREGLPFHISGSETLLVSLPCQVLWVLFHSCFSDGMDPGLQRDCPLPDGAQADGASSPLGSVNILPPGRHCPASLVFSSLITFAIGVGIKYQLRRHKELSWARKDPENWKL